MSYSTALHEAGHAVVAAHFRGPCVYSVEIIEGGGGQVLLDLAGARPGDKAATAVAGALAQRLAGLPGMMSREDHALLEKAYGEWGGGTVRGLERRAFTAAAVQAAAWVLTVRAGEVQDLASAFQETGDVPLEYRSDLRRVGALLDEALAKARLPRLEKVAGIPLL